MVAALMFGDGAVRAADEAAPSTSGYYRFPTVHGETVVFTAEGDLWRVSIRGGVAGRLTSHPGEEAPAALSPVPQAAARVTGPTPATARPMASPAERRPSAAEVVPVVPSLEEAPVAPQAAGS